MAGSDQDNTKKPDTAVAQLVEQRIPNPQVAGSSPSRRDSSSEDDADLRDAGRLGFGVYKFGQGYWVRMMTAVFAGILVLAGAAWTWSRLAAISVPVSEWIMPVRQVTGALSPEQEVTLFKGADQVGTAMVSSFVSEGASTATVRLKSMNLGPGRIPLDAERIRVGDAASPAFFGVIEAREAVYLFERVYIQASAAAIFVIIGGLLIYRFVGARPSTVDFLIATDGEMKKVNWSTRKIVQDSTVVVIVATFLIAAFVFSSDFLLSGFFRLIGVLHD